MWGKYVFCFFGKEACLADLLELSKEVSKQTKQIVGFAKGGQQDPSQEAFEESGLLWSREKSLQSRVTTQIVRKQSRNK